MKTLKTLGLIALIGLFASCGHMRSCHKSDGQCSMKKECSSCNKEKCDSGQCQTKKEGDKTAPTEEVKK